MRNLAVVVVVGLSLFVAGCGSESSSESSSEPVRSPSASASPVASDDPCALLTADEINGVLATTFESGKAETDDAREIMTCTYTMTDSSTGVDLPVGIVVVGQSLVDGQESYDTNVDLAPAYFGNDSEPVDVAGASKAYVVINESTTSPVVGMLVGEQFLQVQVGVEGATVEQAQQLAGTVASRAA
jgi:uncharacterized protein YceK